MYQPFKPGYAYAQNKQPIYWPRIIGGIVGFVLAGGAFMIWQSTENKNCKYWNRESDYKTYDISIIINIL